jgi:hypothetical protein
MMTLRASNVPASAKMIMKPVPSLAGKAEFAQVAEADGNRTRRRRCAPSAGFEDRGDHQVP